MSSNFESSVVVRPVLSALVLVVLLAGLLFFLSRGTAGLPPLGHLLDPLDGLYRTARTASHPVGEALAIDGLDAPVTVVRDDRGVPHIFAESDRDAIIGLGYVVAQDRLFQLDFIPRVASGRLSEVFGEASLEADRFLRRTGMDWGARRNAERILREDGLERDLIEWFGLGANAYIDQLEEKDLPLEFRLLGYRPERYSVMHAVRLLQYFAYDLTYRTDDTVYGELRELLGNREYDKLYPRDQVLYVPIVPDTGSGGTSRADGPDNLLHHGSSGMQWLSSWQRRLFGSIAEGFVAGKGSNNWVVDGARSTTGAPILAGDMHLSLTLPAIWYEAHIVTPNMNVYGVTTPGTPLLIEAFNDSVAWAYTNTGADVIDHYRLELDETRRRYRYEDGWRDLELVADTIVIKGREPVIDTLYYAHWGPVVLGEDGEAVATQWVAHKTSRTLEALWYMNHAGSIDDLREALRLWDTPMQNIVQADVQGNIAIRSTGYLPLRAGGHGVGLLDGSTSANEWVGRVPFEELPHADNPEQGFLTSTNQQPTPAGYPHYLGHDWRSSYRSLRIDALLREKERHSVDDFRRYQADVHAVQRDLFVPLIDTLSGLSQRAHELRQMLVMWDGETDIDRSEPLILDELLTILERLAWDEGVFQGRKSPAQPILWRMLREDPNSRWLDATDTERVEDAASLLRRALETTADSLETRYGWGREHWRWGDHHQIVFRHLTQSPALQALWRGPFEYPGFKATLSPAGDRPTMHSASWRMIVDLSTSPPTGFGIYPGGQSGDPFSPFYDLHVQDYVDFQYYPLLKPSKPSELNVERVSSRIDLSPSQKM